MPEVEETEIEINKYTVNYHDIEQYDDFTGHYEVHGNRSSIAISSDSLKKLLNNKKNKCFVIDTLKAYK